MCIQATVAPDLRTIRGTMRMSRPFDLVDPFASVPQPKDDRTLLRTFPGRAEVGAVTWHQDGDTLHFETTLPRRFDDGGTVSGRLVAHGGWAPLALDGGRLVPLSWDVTVHLPPEAVGAVNDVAGAEHLRWTGVAERVSLAVVAHGTRTDLPGIALLSPRQPRKSFLRELPRARAATSADEAPIVVVVAPLRRRLARSGPGLVTVSDRAFRVTPPFARFHRVAVATSLATAAVNNPDPLARTLVGTVRADVWAEQLRGDAADTWLSRLSWLPSLNMVLYAGNLPFHSDLLERTWPSDPLRDDLAERFSPGPSGRWMVSQLEGAGGSGTASVVANAVAAGTSLVDAIHLAGLPLDVATAIVTGPPPQDYTLDVSKAQVTVFREAPPGSPAEIVAVKVDDTTFLLSAAPGTTAIPLARPARRVVMDPGGDLLQTSRLGERWPERFDVTAAAFIDAIDLDALTAVGQVVATLRRTWDTHNLESATLYNTESTRVGLRLAHAFKRGELLDGLSRAHRILVSAGVASLDPKFATVTGPGVAVDGGLSWTWDTREERNWPLTGSRLQASVTGSAAPGTDDRAVAGHLAAVQVGAASPRVVWAMRVGASVAAADLQHRQLALAGLGSIASLPVLPACPLDNGDGCAPLGSARATAATELRWAVLRGANVPLALAWGTELQLIAGPEAGLLHTDDGEAVAVGAVVGLGGMADVLGLDPTLLGLTAGWPLWTSGPVGTVPADGVPQLWLRWAQRF